MNLKVQVAAALAAVIVQASIAEDILPEPWFKNGQAPAVKLCEAGVDSDIASAGTPNMTLKCRTNEEGFVSVMQQFSAERYRGNRLRYSALMKSEDVDNWGGLWMRIDAPGKFGTAFDNMQRRPVTGTQEWTSQHVVLDVSDNADAISIGVLMEGRGQVWVADLQLEVVGTDVPVTDLHDARNLPDGPANLELNQ
jgi:hypothetical protein